MTEKQPARARTTVTRDRVLAAAVALADTQGIDALTMRELGQSLGISAMALYNHIANKDDLLDALVDRVVAEIELAPPGTAWRAAMRHRAYAAHAVLVRHPWACPLLMSRMNVGPAMIRYIDWTLGCLLGAGFTHEQADRTWNALDSFIYGFTLQKLNFPLDPERYQEVAASYLPSISAERHPHFRSLTAEVAHGRHAGIQDLGFGLEMLLDGLERLLAEGANHPVAGGRP